MDLSALEATAKSTIYAADSLRALDDVRVRYLGKNGEITSQLKTLGSLPPEQRKEAGAAINAIKQTVATAIDAKKTQLETAALDAKLAAETLDITLDAAPSAQGSIHPITQVTEELIHIFSEFGFKVAEGPQIEDDFHNFTALNIPEHHPARQMHDTFYLQAAEGEEAPVLRTHTSPVQVRTMLSETPPIRIIAPGPTYRSDSDQTHTPMFHQIEGLVIEEHVHMGHLKGMLRDMLCAFFGLEDVPMRLRASFFPFTEPSAEVDIACHKSKDGLVIGEGDDWLEVAGCGMVHPNVLRHGGMDPETFQGFAFGFGIERLAMLKYNIPDLRTFFQADMRWLQHYGFPAIQGEK
jgi:phenylalanyl-tRNA synthetase alpha chain